MYKINDIVKYGINGVCRITEITTRELNGKVLEYYVLKPISNKNTILFVPTGNKNLVDKMDKLLSREEVIELIDNMKHCETNWVDNDKQRAAEYSATLSEGTRKEIIEMLYTLHDKKIQLEKENKKMHQADEKIMKDAERLINDEFSIVLGVTHEDVADMIVSRINS